MNSMWSDRKYVNIIINVLLFLTGINFLHYGQLILPVICLILFIDNKFRIKVNDLKVFILLCLFAIAFFAFSYQMGFYSVMGFCLPMAYYIGSNIRNDDQKNIKKLIYIIAFGMACHMVCNFLLEILFWHDRLYYLFGKVTHYDIWLFDVIPPAERSQDGGLFSSILFTRVKTTGTSLNYIMLAAISYYLFKYETDKKTKYIGIILFILSTIYCLALGRRTSFIVLAISLLLSFFLDNTGKEKHINKKTIQALLMFSLFVAIIIVLAVFNVFGLRDLLMKFAIFNKIINQGFKTNRLEILFKSIAVAPKYLFGGRKMSAEVGDFVHDLWGDIYDYAGIIPYILMLVYSFNLLKDMIALYRNPNVEKEYRILYSVWFVCCAVIMFIEPVMTGASLFLICVILIATAITKVNQ